MSNRSKLLIITAAVSSIFVIAFAVWYLGFRLPEKRETEERDRLVREYYENKLSLYREENDAYADASVDVAFLGDSLTDGYNLAEYYPQYLTVNRGIGGETTHGLESRMQVTLYDLKPKVAVMLIGGNNLNTMFENYENMLADFQERVPDTKIILCSLTAMGGSWKHKNQIAAYNNVIIKKLAAKYGYSFVDLYTPLFDLTASEIYADYTTDGVHLTPRGYEVLTEAITPAIDAILKGEK